MLITALNTRVKMLHFVPHLLITFVLSLTSSLEGSVLLVGYFICNHNGCKK